MVRGETAVTEWKKLKEYIFTILSFQTRQKKKLLVWRILCILSCSYLCGYKRWPRWVVEAAQLAVWAEVGAGSWLRFHDGCELVGGVIHSSSVGEVDESAGREAVTSRWGTPGETDDTMVTRLVREAAIHSNREMWMFWKNIYTLNCYSFFLFFFLITWCWDHQ